jgi:hypothetical protein
MSNFQEFSQKINARFMELSQHELFVIGDDNNEFWQAYLAAFPEGTNPLYKTRTEHDCSCCKNFIRNLSNVVAIIDGKRQSIWDVGSLPAPYDTVAKKMLEFSQTKAITSLFRTGELSYGAAQSLQKLEDGTVKRWNHFYGKVDGRYVTKSAGTQIGEYNGSLAVLKRGLTELTNDSLLEVIGLIESKSLYRGEEHLTAVKDFYNAKLAYEFADNKEVFLWASAGRRYSRFRNTVIGSLVVDLSNGVEAEHAVKSFEEKVAPANYKRPTAVITAGQIKQAMATIEELGLEPSLTRRLAKLSDVSINNVLWADNSTKNKMKGGIESLLMDSVKPTAIDINQTPTPISIDEFMSSVLPIASSIELLVKSSHQGNFVSLTAPAVLDAGKLFKWDNDFAWSYSGNITDSIKERVKAAGGSVTGDLCCRLAWDFSDDLDFHMVEPTGNRIYFATRRTTSACGGRLDLDANGADGQKPNPAENIVYADKRHMKDGNYQLIVNCYSRRSSGVGFDVEIEFEGKSQLISYDKAMKSGEYVTVATIQYTKAGGFKILNSLSMSTKRVTKWGITTETFVPVSTLMYSPNYWDGNATGNKHWFFMLENCKSDERTRGIYNEFLKPSLEQHRKVFEVLGEKTKCNPTPDQLSGLGFSSTKGDTVTVKVTGSKTKLFSINF